MAGGVGDEPGGIVALGALVGEHPGEIRHLLLSHGLRWRDRGRLWDWADLHVLVRFAPDSAPIRRALSPDVRVWGQVEYLLADLYDLGALAIRLMSRGKVRPKPYPRPGDESVQRIGKAKRMSWGEARRRRAQRRRGEGVRASGEASPIR